MCVYMSRLVSHELDIKKTVSQGDLVIVLHIYYYINVIVLQKEIYLAKQRKTMTMVYDITILGILCCLFLTS